MPPFKPFRLAEARNGDSSPNSAFEPTVSRPLKLRFCFSSAFTQKNKPQQGFFFMVPTIGLEPTRLTALAPHASVSTNSTTSAAPIFYNFMRCYPLFIAQEFKKFHFLPQQHTLFILQRHIAPQS